MSENTGAEFDAETAAEFAKEMDMDVTPNEDLRKLVAVFRKKREEASEDNALATGIAIGYDAAADRIENLIDGSTNK